MKNTNKKAIYAKHGIEFENGKILAPLFGFIAPLLVNGNEKLGKGVWTWSMLPGTGFYSVMIGGEPMEVKGTCLCNCPGCYAMTGFYNMPSVKTSNAIKTALARMYMDFVKRAIIAQIEADEIKLCRIHASGEFFSPEYIELWREIVAACGTCLFWTYTKNPDAENAFDEFENINIVKSVIKGHGYNYGECGYIIDLFFTLKALGKKVHICRCGVDKSQHCNTCRGCAENEIVLFLKHSTAYKPENDARFAEFCFLVEVQDSVSDYAEFFELFRNAA